MKAITQNEFENRIKIKFPEENFKIIQYTTMSNPLKIQCCNCNKIMEYPQAKNFLVKSKKAGCSDCNGLKFKNNCNLQKLQIKYEIIKQEKDSLGKNLVYL